MNLQSNCKYFSLQKLGANVMQPSRVPRLTAASRLSSSLPPVVLLTATSPINCHLLHLPPPSAVPSLPLSVSCTCRRHPPRCIHHKFFNLTSPSSTRSKIHHTTFRHRVPSPNLLPSGRQSTVLPSITAARALIHRAARHQDRPALHPPHTGRASRARAPTRPVGNFRQNSYNRSTGPRC
jgi:hypothetical protein